MHMSLCGSMCKQVQLLAEARRWHQMPWGWAVVSCQACVLGTELRPSEEQYKSLITESSLQHSINVF